MLVYGDGARLESPADKLALIEDAVGQILRMPAGIERHGTLVSAFVDVGELMQGIADAEFAEHGHDGPSPTQDRAMALLMMFAQAVGASWRNGFDKGTALSAASLDGLRTARLPDRIQARRAEGYAFYALYPEAYFEAGLGLDGGRTARVIGIRSIGASLAAMVAVAAGSPAPVTVRPVGHPFRRELSLAPELAAALTSDRAGAFAVVDEGPGLSGSSFGAVADFLEQAGVALPDIHFFPSHAGDLGPQADPRHRARWQQAARHRVDVDALILHSSAPAHRLTTWVADLVGEPEGPLEDLSGGAWRHRCFAREDDWPAINGQQERRKFLLRAGGASWLLKFAGLGRNGSRKLPMGRELYAAGFSPELAGYRHGFLVQRWVEPARRLNPDAIDHNVLVRRVGQYLGFRARRFEAGPGASVAALWRMARHNIVLALGASPARRLDCWRPELDRLERVAHRIATDNRMQPWEWLVLDDGLILKTDTLDHHAAHDLIGCQDVAWDIVGATVELGLSATEQQRICAIVERESGRAISPDLLLFLTPCYLAFQLGHNRLGAETLAGWPAEARRLRRAAERYGRMLAAALRD